MHLYCDEHSLNVLAADPQLADTKIITVGWNSDRGTYKHMASCNNDAQNTIRRYLKGDEDMLRPFINMAGANPYNLYDLSIMWQVIMALHCMIW